MTKPQVEASIAKFKKSWTESRNELLILFEGRAHKARGIDMPSFADFARDHLGINVSDRSIDYHLRAARVERSLGEFRSQGSAIVAPLPLLAAVELNKLPPAEMAEVFTTYEALKPLSGFTPAQAARELGRMVKAKIASRDALSSVVPPRVKPDLTPTVPPVYDGTPEAEDLDGDEDTEAVLTERDAQESIEADQFAATEQVENVHPLGLPRYEEAITFLRRFNMHMLSGDRDAMECLHVDVREFLKELAL